MDPNTTLQRIIDAALSGDAAELRDAANDLAEWLERGGFAPNEVFAPTRAEAESV